VNRAIQGTPQTPACGSSEPTTFSSIAGASRDASNTSI
jgi:hypothetical protein